MTRRIPAAVLACVALAAGCGDDDDEKASGGGGGAGKAAQIEQADAAVEKNDFDGAIEILRGLGDDPAARERLAEVKVVAARETLANARRKLKGSPRAAVSLTETSLRYNPTPEARAFLPKAQAALKRFKRSGKDDD